MRSDNEFVSGAEAHDGLLSAPSVTSQQTPSPGEMSALKFSWECLISPGKCSVCQALVSPPSSLFKAGRNDCPLYTDEKLRPGKEQEYVKGVKMQDENSPLSPFSCVKL